MSSSPGTLFSTFVNTCKYAEFPVCEVIEIDVERYFSYSRVENRHMSLELPEGVDEENRVVPSILTRSVTCASCFRPNILPECRGYSRELHDTAIRNEGHCEVWMIMCRDDSPGWDFFLWLVKVSTMPLQGEVVPPLPHLRQPEDFSSLRSSSVQGVVSMGGQNGRRGSYHSLGCLDPGCYQSTRYKNAPTKIGRAHV